MDRRKRDREGTAASEAEGARTDSESTSFDDGSLRGTLGSGATMDFSSEKDDTLKKNVVGERRVRAKVDDSSKAGSGQAVDVGEGLRQRGSVRPSGGKDRHSKVRTSKGLRDRRVRLSVATAIQFYDVQDRLGYDQPSKAVEWLLKKAKAAIDDLPLLPSTAEGASGGGALAIKSGLSQAAVPRFYPPQGVGLPRSSSFKEAEREEEEEEHLQEAHMLESSAKEGGDCARERVELRTKARERARERVKERTTGKDPSSPPSHSPDQQSFFSASIPHSTPGISFDSSLHAPTFTSLLQTPFPNLVSPHGGLYNTQGAGQLFQQALLQAEHNPSRQFLPPFQHSFGSLPPTTLALDMSFYSPPITSPGLFPPQQLPAAPPAGILSSPSDLFTASASQQFRPGTLLEESSSASYLQGWLRPHHSLGMAPLQFEQPFLPSQPAHHFASSLDGSVSGPRELGSDRLGAAGAAGAPGASPLSYYQPQGSLQQFPGILQGIGSNDDDDEIRELKDGRSSSPRARRPP